ncbi:MAG TPA: TetR/AcrR family transcriptional regulator [Ktedonobacteraceae bacterium]
MEQRKSNEREDPRVLRTRQLLLQAFSDLFSEKGFHAMTVQDITERARVNRGTFYTHFEDKYAILECWLREQFQQRVASTVLISGLWSPGTFRLLIQSVVEWFTQLHQLTRSADRSLIPLVVTTLQEALFELLLQGFKPVAGSGLDQQVDLETVAMVTSWAIFGTGFQCFHQWDEQTVALPPEELASQVTRVLMSGVAQALPTFPLT